MRHFVKEYGYLAVMCVCLVSCLVLLVSVTIDRPLVAVAREHIPVLRTQKEGEHHPENDAAGTESADEETVWGTQSGYVLTEDYLEGRLAGFLPDNFPATDIDAAFENGLVEFSFSMDRSALRDYLKSQGVDLSASQNLLFQMLPGKLEAEIDFALSADENGLHLQPVKVELGDKEFSLTDLPQNVFSAVDEGLNALLQSAGVRFSTVEFVEDGLLLK